MIGVQFRQVAFFDRLTLDELLRPFGDLYGTRVDPGSLLDLVGLTGRRTMVGRRPRRFS